MSDDTTHETTKSVPSTRNRDFLFNETRKTGAAANSDSYSTGTQSVEGGGSLLCMLYAFHCLSTKRLFMTETM